MTTAVREAPHHNNLTCYTDYRCRRPDCVERYNRRNNARLQAHKAGTWNDLVDAAPVRQHLLRLQAEGIGAGWVAVSTGLSIQNVRDFLVPNPKRQRGRRQRTSPDIAAKILAVSVENHARGKVSGIGAVRRTQALIAAGWPLKHIAIEARLSAPNMSDLLRRKTIYASTARSIHEAYEQLSLKKPERNGVDKAQAKRARNWAARERWNTPRYWADRMDLIDDPHFEPEGRKLRAEILAEEAHWLMTAGRLSREQAADRLGVSLFTVDRALREHPQGETAVAA